MNKKVKNKRITVRFDDEEYCRLTADAYHAGFPDLSSYVRGRVVDNMKRVFYDPNMTAELKQYRTQIRTLVQEVEQVRRNTDQDDKVKLHQIAEIMAVVKSIYYKLEDIEQVLSGYQKELVQNGNHKTA